jgi:AbrB family transcriptional regulator (stage V sporulation protein T)
MRATGIVRRIDELGRVVIPKEIRRTMKIREGEELEVFTGEDDSLILKKYSAVREFSSFAGEYASSVYLSTGYTALVFDMDTLVAASGDIRAYKIGNPVSFKLEKILNDRKPVLLSGRELISLCGEDLSEIGGMAIAPIINAGDIMGAFVIVSSKELGEMALKFAAIGANFLSTQL